MHESADRRAFEQTVLPHLDAAYNVARHIVHSDADARDVVQESLLRAWRYFGSFRGKEGLPWLLQIVRNAAFTVLSRKEGQQELPEELALVDDATDPAAQAVLRADAQSVRAAMDSLPAIFREALVLRELEGLSYKQIAQVTGTTMGTVMSRISRARRQLEGVLRSADGPPVADEKAVRRDM